MRPTATRGDALAELNQYTLQSIVNLQQFIDTRVLLQCYMNTYQVVCKATDGEHGGSGVLFVSRGKYYVLTASHVVMTEPDTIASLRSRLGEPAVLNTATKVRGTITVHDYAGTELSAKLVYWLRQFDLALLLVDEPAKVRSETVCQLTIENPALNDRLFLCGRLWKNGALVREARVHKHKPRVTMSSSFLALNFIEVNERIIPGFSGGPVFTSEGRLAGIVCSTDNLHAYFTHPTSIVALLEKFDV
ncbi:MAG: serine protease [Candidatus Paceibacterota bacterium]